jgi:hypothetical protein
MPPEEPSPGKPSVQAQLLSVVWEKAVMERQHEAGFESMRQWLIVVWSLIPVSLWAPDEYLSHRRKPSPMGLQP